MVLETVLSGLFGGILRLAPEVLGIWDKKNERKHELALGEQQYRVAQLQFTSQTTLKQLDLDQSQFVSTMQALAEGAKAQATPTGIKWVDAISALVRPGITTWIFVLYSIVKLCALAVALETKELSAAILATWGPEDASLLASVVMFWFVGRVYTYKRDLAS